MTLRNPLRSLLVLALTLSATTAFAQTGEPLRERTHQAPDRVVVRKNTHLDFGGEAITADVKRPEGEVYISRPKAKFDSLIRVRQNFDGEFNGSVDAL